jgi:hypothetical protein
LHGSLTTVHRVEPFFVNFLRHLLFKRLLRRHLHATWLPRTCCTECEQHVGTLCRGGVAHAACCRLLDSNLAELGSKHRLLDMYCAPRVHHCNRHTTHAQSMSTSLMFSTLGVVFRVMACATLNVSCLLRHGAGRHAF